MQIKTKKDPTLRAQPGPAIRRSSVFAYLWGERLPLAIIVGFFLLSCLLVSPLKNAPVIDDWTYAWSVENFIKTHHLAVLDWSAHYPIFQTLWGGLFSLVFGFSFGVLRISTVVLAAAGCAALYLTFRELEIERWPSLVGALILAVNPIFFVLSFSFMTDVPFLSLMNIAAFFFVAGIKRDRASLLWVGGRCGVAGYLGRQIGLVIPLALLPCRVQRRGGWPGILKRALPMLGSLAVVGLLWRWEVKTFGRTSVMKEKMEALDYLFPIGFGHFIKESIEDLALNAFWVSPILLAAISIKRKWWPLLIIAMALVSVAVMHFGFKQIIYPLESEGTWNVDELGSARGLMHGENWARTHVHALIAVLRWLMIAAWGVLLAGLVTWGIKHRKQMIAISWIHDFSRHPAMVLMTMALLNLILIDKLWFFYDRYYIVLLPAVIYLSLKVAAQWGFSRVIALSGTLILALVSIAGTADMLRFDQAAWDTYYELRAAGVPASDIDAGYAINGWMLYAHPENLSAGSDPKEDVPFITGDDDLLYKISTSASNDADYETVKEKPIRMPFWSV